MVSAVSSLGVVVLVVRLGVTLLGAVVGEDQGHGARRVVVLQHHVLLGEPVVQPVGETRLVQGDFRRGERAVAQDDRLTGNPTGQQLIQ